MTERKIFVRYSPGLGLSAKEKELYWQKVTGLPMKSHLDKDGGLVVEEAEEDSEEIMAGYGVGIVKK